MSLAIANTVPGTLGRGNESSLGVELHAEIQYKKSEGGRKLYYTSSLERNEHVYDKECEQFNMIMFVHACSLSSINTGDLVKLTSFHYSLIPCEHNTSFFQSSQ